MPSENETNKLLMLINHSSRQRCTQVLASVLGVDMVEVVRSWPDVIDRAFGGVVDGIVVLLAELCNSMSEIQ